MGNSNDSFQSLEYLTDDQKAGIVQDKLGLPFPGHPSFNINPLYSHTLNSSAAAPPHPKSENIFKNSKSYKEKLSNMAQVQILKENLYNCNLLKQKIEFQGTSELMYPCEASEKSTMKGIVAPGYYLNQVKNTKKNPFTKNYNKENKEQQKKITLKGYFDQKSKSQNVQLKDYYQNSKKKNNIYNEITQSKKENQKQGNHQISYWQEKQLSNLQKESLLRIQKTWNDIITKNILLEKYEKNTQSHQINNQSQHEQYQQGSELPNQAFHNNDTNVFYESSTIFVDSNQEKSQLPQTASNIQEVKVQEETNNKEKPSHKSSNSSCYSSSQMSQESIHTKDLIKLDEKPASNVTYTIFKENQQILPKIQQKPLTVSQDAQTVAVESQKVKGQKVEGQLKEQKQAQEEVQSLRQRVKQLQQLNKQYLCIIENLSFTVNNMSLIPQQLNNNKPIKITEKKEKEQPNSSKKSIILPKQQLFEQEQY